MAGLRGCLPAKQRSGPHGVGEDGDRTAVGVTAQVRDGRYPPGPREDAGTGDCAPPGGRSPAQSFQSPGTATLQGGLSCRMNGHGGPCPSHRVHWEGPCPCGPQEKADTGARAEPAARLNRPGALARSDRSGGTASPPSARISGTGDCGPPGGRSPPNFFNRRGRRPCWGASAAAWAGTGDRAPPGESANRRHPSPFARSGGSASRRSGKIAGAEDCAPPWESPDRRHPAAFGSSRGTASPRSAGTSGTEDCAPPARSHGRGRVPAVRSNAPIISCLSQADSPVTWLLQAHEAAVRFPGR
jgi:hypothetical protein